MYECCWPTLEVLVPGYAEVGSVCAGAAGQGLPGGHMTTWGNQTVATRLVTLLRGPPLTQVQMV